VNARRPLRAGLWDSRPRLSSGQATQPRAALAPPLFWQCLAWALLVLGLSGAPATARGAALEARVEKANGLYAAEKYSEALEVYTQAAAEAPGRLEVAYNQGCCQYALGHYAEAEELFRQVDRESRELRLAGAARYNLGNCAFKAGLKQADSDLQKALDLLQASAASYQRARELLPHDQDAAQNIEVVRLVIKDLLDRLKKQQEEQKKQQQQQEDLLKKLQELAQRQEAAAQKSAEAAKKPASAPDRAQQAAGLQAEQEKITGETQEAREQLQKQTPPPDAKVPPEEAQKRQAAGEELEKAQVEQKLAERGLEQQQPAKAEAPQHQAAKKIEEALKKLAGQPPPQGGQQPQPQPDEAKKQEQEQQKQDATVAELLEKERRDREEREKMRPRMSGLPPVDKDW